jgi:hypothetical protein
MEKDLRPASAARVERYLEGRFGDDLARPGGHGTVGSLDPT